MAPHLEGQLWPVSTREARLAGVEIRQANAGRLVTAIEIFSPANKPQPGLENHRAKRGHLLSDGIHLFETNLLRRRAHPKTDPLVAGCDDVIALAPAGRMAVWQVGLRENLPVVSDPLPHPDVALDLQAAPAAIFGEAGYALSIQEAAP
jgi:hypothetical protein